VRSRRNWNMTDRVPELRKLPRGLVLDGELVAFNEVGAPHWPLLCERVLHGNKAVAVTFVAFDVLRVDGYDLTATSWVARRAVLEELGVATWCSRLADKWRGRRARTASLPGPSTRPAAGRCCPLPPNSPQRQRAFLAAEPIRRRCCCLPSYPDRSRSPASFPIHCRHPSCTCATERSTQDPTTHQQRAMRVTPRSSFSPSASSFTSPKVGRYAGSCQVWQPVTRAGRFSAPARRPGVLPTYPSGPL
jgi:hypothetical protein